MKRAWAHVVDDDAFVVSHQEVSSVDAFGMVFGIVRDVAPLGHDLAQIVAPVRIELIHDEMNLRGIGSPVTAERVDELSEDGGGTIRSQQSVDFARGDIERRRQAASPVSDVFVFDALRDTRDHRQVRGLSFQGLDAGFLIQGEHHSPLSG